MAKMIYCRTCGAQIAKSAKTCPHCGAKNRRHRFLKFLLAVIVICGIGSYISNSNNKLPQINQIVSLAERASEAIRTSKTEPASEAEHTSEAISASEAEPESTEAPAAADSSDLHSESDSPSETEAAAESTAAADEVTPELKEFLDKYEEVMNEYCDFMASYDPSDAGSIVKYTTLLQKYLEFAEKAEAYGEKEMSNADMKYYIDVTARIEKRMIDSIGE